MSREKFDDGDQRSVVHATELCGLIAAIPEVLVRHMDIGFVLVFVFMAFRMHGSHIGSGVLFMCLQFSTLSNVSSEQLFNLVFSGHTILNNI